MAAFLFARRARLRAERACDVHVRIWDSQAQAPYLWNKDTRTFISYEDPESLRLKSAYIREKGLGGAMFWEYYADKTGVLLDTLFTSLHGPATPRTSGSK